MTEKVFITLLEIILLYLCLLDALVESINGTLPASSASVSNLNLPNKRLQHLHILFRHGDRSPFYNPFHPDEPFEKLWPAGRGQLSDEGIRQEFQLGQWIRKQYNSFIPTEYNGSDFHMRSTDIDRTLMSAQSVIAGVYQKASTPLKPDGLAWRPIPVHTVKQVQFASTVDIIRLEIGVFLTSFVDHVNAVIGGGNSPVVPNHRLSVQHTMAYSSHDTDVTYLLAALGSFDNQLVVYSSTVILELLGPSPPAPPSEYVVRVLYKRGFPDEKGTFRPIVACPNVAGEDGCPWDRVLVYLEPFLLTEIEFRAVCQLNHGLIDARVKKDRYIYECSGPTFNNYKIVYAVVGVLVAICLVAIAIFLLMRWRRRRQMHFWLNE